MCSPKCGWRRVPCEVLRSHFPGGGVEGEDGGLNKTVWNMVVALAHSHTDTSEQEEKHLP